MPVFLQGRRAFLSSLRRRHRRSNPLSVHRVTDSDLAYPRRAYSCLAYPRRACPCRAYSCRACPAAAAPLRLPSATPTLSSPPPAVAAFGYRSAARTATPPAWSEMPPRTAPLLQFYPEHHHGPCPFSCSTRRRTADPRPGSARGTKKRTEPHRGPSAAKKQPICRGSITAAALQPVRSVHAPETDPFRIVRAGISG